MCSWLSIQAKCGRPLYFLLSSRSHLLSLTISVLRTQQLWFLTWCWIYSAQHVEKKNGHKNALYSKAAITKVNSSTGHLSIPSVSVSRPVSISLYCKDMKLGLFPFKTKTQSTQLPLGFGEVKSGLESSRLGPSSPFSSLSVCSDQAMASEVLGHSTFFSISHPSSTPHLALEVKPRAQCTLGQHPAWPWVTPSPPPN